MKNLITAALLFSGSLFAQNVFLGDRECYDHTYKSVVNTDEYAKWVIDGEKEWYLAPDSIESRIMTVKQWSAKRLQLKANGFNELDSEYYWNPTTKTVVLVFRTKLGDDKLCITTEHGTDIR